MTSSWAATARAGYAATRSSRASGLRAVATTVPPAAGAAAAIERPEPEDAPADGTDNVPVQGFARVVRELASSAPVVNDRSARCY
ncbi:hypothetical protein [Streptomyces atratus]|uniref:hypothetical protein n=1 Tax=Streptomyces TaxID=1883 RepID=UPI0037B86333